MTRQQKIFIASHCCTSLLVEWWKVKSYTTSGSCRSANALWRFVICQISAALDGCSFCHYIRHCQNFEGKLWTHLSCQLSCGYLRMAQFAAPVADDLGRKQLCIDHKNIAWWWRQQKLITVREHAYFQSGCNKVFTSHTFRAWASWDKLEPMIDSQFEGWPTNYQPFCHLFWWFWCPSPYNLKQDSVDLGQPILPMGKNPPGASASAVACAQIFSPRGNIFCWNRCWFHGWRILMAFVWNE